MQGMKIYVLIEDNEKESEVRIDGNLDTLRKLIYTLQARPANSALGNSLPDEDIENEPDASMATH